MTRSFHVLDGVLAVALIVAMPPASRATTFQVERVDTTGISAVSLALGADGTPHIFYADGLNEAARYGRKTGGVWTYDRLDYAFFHEGEHSSLELDSSGNPRVVYQAVNLQFPIYARKSGGAWAFEAAQGGEQSGMYNSLELDTQGFPHFTDYTGGLTYIIRYHRRTAPGWTIEYVDAINDIGISGTSLALDANDVPHVTYNRPSLALCYASRIGGVWTCETIEPTGSGVWSPIAIDAQGNPCVAYTSNGAMRYARRVGGAWTIEAPDIGAPSGFATLSMALDAQGEPHLLYSAGFFEGNLCYARRENGLWTEEVIVDTENSVGYANALVLDASDDPHIAFVDATAGHIYYGRVPAGTRVGAGQGAEDPARNRPRIEIAPNPSRGGDIAIRVFGSAAARDRAQGADRGAHAMRETAIFDASGRLVKSLGGLETGAPDPILTWDGRGDDGRAAAPGVYFVRLGTGGAAIATKRFTIVR